MTKSSDSDEQLGKGAKIGVFVGIVIIIILLVVVIVLLVRRQNEPEEETRRNVVVTQENAEEVAEQIINQEYVPQGYYASRMTTTWHFSSGDAISEDAYVENAPDNTNDIYFDVFLSSDESTPILESPVIPIGGKLENIALDTVLSAGTYDCVLVYHLVDEDQNTVSTLRVGFTIIVEN